MEIKTLPTTLLEIFYKSIFHFLVIVISVIDTDNNFKSNPYI